MRLALAALEVPAAADEAMAEQREAAVLTAVAAVRQARVAVAAKEPQPESSESQTETSTPVVAAVVRLAAVLLLERLALAVAPEEILARATRMLIQAAGAAVLTMAGMTVHLVLLSFATQEIKGGQI